MGKLTKKQVVAIFAVIVFVAKQYGLDEAVGLGNGSMSALLDLILVALTSLGIVDNSGGE